MKWPTVTIKTSYFPEEGDVVRDLDGDMLDYRPEVATDLPDGTYRLVPADALVIVKENGEWPDWTVGASFHNPGGSISATGLLDDLAAAQEEEETA